jgi:predicted RNA binding protein YcfA (HicA-like mRNA interferase family)
MPRLTPETWQVLKCIFTLAGFVNWRSEGDHWVASKPGYIRPIVVPAYKDVDPDIISGLLRTAKMSRDEYFALRNKCK